MTNNFSFTRAAIGATVAAAALSGYLASALPAAADTTGFDTGYQYTQGLAIGAGGQLMQGADTGSAPVAQSQTVPVATANGSALTQTTQPVAVEAATPAAQTAVAPAAVATGFSLADIAMPAAWIALLALLILISLGAWALSGSRERQRYHQPAYR